MSSCRHSHPSILITSSITWPATWTGRGVRTCCRVYMQGVDIGFQGIRKSIWSGNWKLALDNGSVVSKYLATEVALGRKVGPFTQLPFHIYVGSPMGVVIKKHSDSVKYCIIHDLSWPPRDSVNDHINPDLYCCVYASFDQAVSLAKKAWGGCPYGKTGPG